MVKVTRTHGGKDVAKRETSKLTMNTQETYVAQAQARIDEIMEGAKHVEEQKAEAPEMIRKEMEECAVNINGHLGIAEGQLDELAHAGVNEWTVMRVEVDRAIGEAQAELERAHELLSNPYARVRKPGLFPRQVKRGE
jgi:hypothetical protein